MEKGKLKYFPEDDFWRIVSKKGCLYEPYFFHTFIEIKIDAKYRGCFITLSSKEDKESLYIEFWDTSFLLDTSITYEIKYEIPKKIEFPF